MVMFLLTGPSGPEKLLELPRDRDGPQDRLNILLPAGLAVADILRRKGPREVEMATQKWPGSAAKMQRRRGKNAGKMWKTGKKWERLWNCL